MWRVRIFTASGVTATEIEAASALDAITKAVADHGEPKDDLPVTVAADRIGGQ